MTTYGRFYIDGSWVPPTSDHTLDVVDSITEQVMYSVPAGMATDVDAAVSAARGALPGWSASPVEIRADYLRKIADGIAKRTEAIAAAIARETGMSVTAARMIQVGLPIHNLGTAAAVGGSYAFESRRGTTVIRREPIGVVGCITPWNYPLHQAVAKIAYATVAGCTVVLKPSEVAPSAAFVLAEVADEVGLPAGVFNMVTGVGAVAGEALVGHPDVDMVSFTGSTAAGKQITRVAAGTVKRVTLELGGKSANILLDDLDDDAFAAAVSGGVQGSYLNSGQTCAAQTRLLVPRARLGLAEQVAAATVAQLKVGDPFDEDTQLGPLASASQRDRVQDYINSGIADGATLVAGGPGAPTGIDKGFYVRPTVFSDVQPGMSIAQEEIFGPVLSIMPHDGDDHAVEIANAVAYGLAGGVWATDTDRAAAVARRLQAGQVLVNGGSYDPEAPFGGYKQSGNGREFGPFGLEEFLEVKSILLPAG
ncbi:MAG: aldehyde dehydrogenase family protein [Pseudonocardia sp.]|uniref:aldehyde dehydrogenase family protein n=1 Tax=unclassified Pseudonocardia TaxID=2619320 RepID=UPI000868D2D4|nr:MULTISPECIES: aldehyde dehydrogenase family protein [unclassified Pseudonocardia]MBN9112448.1 aldehyde dehydrogenase family protein [Pseudonocardia sp.]ODU27284.1 MAG: aldehyde dehydrogenase [Pseudonocardia sp. SCN 72-51]ODV08897.1 MAG: aldehyde dehydrogenase [Pseudonocardia sp. SCN 73-27]